MGRDRQRIGPRQEQPMGIWFFLRARQKEVAKGKLDFPP